MKFQERVKAVQEAIDLNVLAEICMADQEHFSKYGKLFVKDNKKEDFAFYCRETPSEILGIAHLDSVQKGKDFGVAKYVSGAEIVLSPALDDRLGVYVICELLPKLGIKTDILLTTDEERGSSTASIFKTDKKYKWMFQFDRMGDDVVMYQYDTPKLREKLVDAGFKCGNGSASDISKLSDLGCSGMNFGVGYQDYHDAMAWADLKVLSEQVARFMKFFHKYQREHLVYEKKTYQTHSPVWDGGSYMGGADYESEFGARRGGNWYSNMIWDEPRQVWIPNINLYKKFPTASLPTVKRILTMNEKWSNKEQKFLFAEGKYTEEEILKFAHEALVEAGHTQVSLPLDDLETYRKTNHALESYGRLNKAPEEGSINDACMCGHSRYVHHRMQWIHGVRGTKGCDFWKCTCKDFESADRSGS